MLKFGILCLVLVMLGNTYLHLRKFHFNKDFQDLPTKHPELKPVVK